MDASDNQKPPSFRYARIPTDQLCRDIYDQLGNMCAALRCSVCLSSVQQPVLLNECRHGPFCHRCIRTQLEKNHKCPICRNSDKGLSIRRSVMPADDLTPLVEDYKRALRRFGLAPEQHDASIDHMTQMATDSSPASMVTTHQGLQLARLFRVVYRENKALRAKHDRVIAVNQRTLVERAVQRQQGPSDTQLADDAREQLAVDASMELDKDDSKTPAKLVTFQDLLLDQQSPPVSQSSFYSAKESVSGPLVATAATVPAVDQTPVASNLAGGGDVVGSPRQHAHLWTAPGLLAAVMEEVVDDNATVDPESKPPATEKQQNDEVQSDDESLSSRDTVDPNQQQAVANVPTKLVSTKEASSMSQETVDPDLELESQGNDGQIGDGGVAQNEMSESRKDQTTSPAGPGIGEQNVQAEPTVFSPTATTDPNVSHGGVGNSDPATSMDANKTNDGIVEEEEEEEFMVDYHEPLVENNPTPLASCEATAVSLAAAAGTAPTVARVTTDSDKHARHGAVLDASATGIVVESQMAAASTQQPELSNPEEQESPDVAPGPEAETIETETMLVQSNASSESTALRVGDVVQVQARTWPGMNKHGGVGRITRVHKEGSSLFYDVKYILGGSEKKVDAVFVTPKDNSLGIQTIQDDEMEVEGATLARKRSNRIAKIQEGVSEDITDEIPASLLAKLAAEGCDTTGKFGLPTDRTSASAKENAKPLSRSTDRKRQNSGSDDAKPRKKRMISAAVDAIAKLVRRDKGTVEEEAYTARPILSDEDKCTNADRLYATRFATKKKTLTVVASALDEAEMKKLEILSQEIQKDKSAPVKIRIAKAFHPERTDMCIIPVASQESDEKNLVARNRRPKAMRAALAGIPIVAPSWISHCLQHKSLDAPSSSMFIRTLPSSRESAEDQADPSKFGVAYLAACKEQDESFTPLRGTAVFLCGGIPRARQDDIAVLLKESGAQLLSHSAAVLSKVRALSGESSATGKVVLMGNSSSKITAGMEKAARQHPDKVLVVNPDWLVDSISCGFALGPQSYPPTDKKAKELWQVTSRVDE